MQTATRKSERFNLRLSPDAKQRIERAASFEGQTVAGFILSSALSRAEQSIAEHEIMVLERRDADVFFDALLNPPRMNPRLIAALEAHTRTVKSR